MSLQRIPMKLLAFTKLDTIIGTVRFICRLNEKTNSEKRDIVKSVYPWLHCGHSRKQQAFFTTFFWNISYRRFVEITWCVSDVVLEILRLRVYTSLALSTILQLFCRWPTGQPVSQPPLLRFFSGRGGCDTGYQLVWSTAVRTFKLIAFVSSSLPAFWPSCEQDKRTDP